MAAPIRVLAVVAFALAGSAGGALGEERPPRGMVVASDAVAVVGNRALVIGNSSYQAAPLRNPLNDARDMAAALRRVGFEVTLVSDAGQQQMEQAIREFGARLRAGGVGLFYYAGHGLQIDGRNYLIPLDATIRQRTDAKYKAVDLGQVLDQFEAAGNRLNILVLDACRDNPFSGTRGGPRGLAKVDAPTGTLIAYATSPGSVAIDGDGRNGVYTKHLLAAMEVPGLPIEQMFKQVRIEVRGETNGGQTPWEASSLVGNFSFRPVANGAAPETLVVGSTRVDSSPEPSTSQLPLRDAFERSELGADYEVVSPDPDRLALSRGAVVVVPAEQPRNVVLLAEPLSADFEASVKVTMDVGDYNRVGLVYYVDEKDWVLVGIENRGNLDYRFFKTLNGESNQISRLYAVGGRYARQSFHFQLQRTGVTYVARVSKDGFNWTELGTHGFLKEGGRVGFAVISGGGPENVAEFDDFMVTPRPIQ